jgi:hypothetical protein
MSAMMVAAVLAALLTTASSGNGGHLEIMACYGMGVYNIGQMAIGKQGGGPEKTPW